MLAFSSAVRSCDHLNAFDSDDVSCWNLCTMNNFIAAIAFIVVVTITWWLLACCVIMILTISVHVHRAIVEFTMW